MQRQRQQRMAAEQQVEMDQQQQMEALRQGFAPDINDLSADVKQAAAFRSGTADRPYYEVLEEERLNEGSRRVIEFSRVIENTSPEQRESLGPLAAALIKEGLPGPIFQDIIEASRQEDGSVYQFTVQQRKKANRILKTIVGARADEGPAFVATTPLIPEDLKSETQAAEEAKISQAEEGVRIAAREGQAQESQRQAALVTDLTEQFGGVDKIPQDVLRESGLTQPTGTTEPIFSISRDLNPATVARFVKDLAAVPFEATDPIFEAEQRIFAPITEPILREAFTQARIPWADGLARLGSEVIVPSSAIPFARGTKGLRFGQKVTAAIPRAIQEGILNVQQNRAAKEVRGEPAPDIIEDLEMFGFGLITGGLGPEVLNGIGRAIEKVRADPSAFGRVSPDPGIAPTARGAPLETAGVRRVQTGDEVALVSDPSASIGQIIAQSEQGVTIRPEGGGKPFLRSRERVQRVVEPLGRSQPRTGERVALRSDPETIIGVSMGRLKRTPEELSPLRANVAKANNALRRAATPENRQAHADALQALKSAEGEALVNVRRLDTSQVERFPVRDVLPVEEVSRAVEAPLDASVARTLDDVPAVARAEVEAGDDIIYSAQFPDRADAIVRGTRDKEVWGTRLIDDVANPGSEDAVILTLRVRQGAVPVRDIPQIKGTKAYKPEDVEVISRTPITEVFDPETIRLAKPISARVEPAPVAPARVVEAGTPEFKAQSAVAKARLQAIIDDPSRPKSVRQNAKKHFDKVCA